MTVAISIFYIQFMAVISVFFKASQLSHAIQQKKFSSKTTFLIFMLHADVCENSNKK